MDHGHGMSRDAPGMDSLISSRIAHVNSNVDIIRIIMYCSIEPAVTTLLPTLLPKHVSNTLLQSQT